jgi:hypothetical protein
VNEALEQEEGNDLLAKAEKAVENAVKSGSDVEQIKKDLTGLIKEDLLDKAISNFAKRQDKVYNLVDPYVIRHQKSLSEKNRWYGGPNEHSKFWHFANERLIAEGRSKEELDDVLHSSSQILGLLSSPLVDNFASRGLVLGYVQSGKTTNFISTIAQAADVGYRLIIVLSGVTNNLRKQTQERLEMSLTGTNSQSWHWLTSADSDFNESNNAHMLLANPGLRVIAVVKKNNSRLKKLRKWLESAPASVRQGLPVLIIDDEADQATVNSHKLINRQTAINKTLTSMLKTDCLPKNAYLGYTATPFANILSDAKDQTQLFPRDFIYPLKRSSKYFGAEQLFGRDPIDEDDQEVSAGRNIIIPVSKADRDALGTLIDPNSQTVPVELPDSLKNAILWFIVATAARRIRSGKNRFSTMLIHTSGRIPSHNDMRRYVKDYLAQLRNLDISDMEALLKDTWTTRAGDGWIEGDSRVLSWDEISETAMTVLRDTKMVVDNSQSDDRLLYDFANESTAVPFIVVGGNTLARGLTLEGLICSYFMRTSNTYDSLLQMGRWFGYRVGYEDLQRIWMQEELILHFKDMALVEEEIRRQLEDMAKEGLDPSQVPVKIRDHRVLAITADNKMKFARRIQIGYSGTRVETISLSSKSPDILDNQRVTRAFIDSVAKSGIDTNFKNPEGWPLLRDVPWSLVKAYLQEYSWTPNARVANGELVAKYIDNHQGTGDMEKWNVFIYQTGKTNLPPIDLGHGIKATQINRSALDINHEAGTINIHHLVSSIDGAADTQLTKKEVTARLKAQGVGVSDRALRRLRDEIQESKNKGLLGIYLIDPKSKAQRPSTGKNDRQDLNLDEAPVGLGIFFGESKMATSSIDYFGPDLVDAIEIADDDYLDEADRIDDPGVM